MRYGNMRTRLQRLGVLAGGLVLTGAIVFAQGKGGGAGGPGGGGHTETATNNLSYPAIHTAEAGTTLTWNVPDGVFGTSYSYGCKREEIVGTTTYPNTSCVDALGNVLAPEACAAAGGKCAGLLLDRIYWQKIAANDWWAESAGPSDAQTATHLDWGDNLESVSWKTTSTLRVETTPFAAASPNLTGYQMWHVFGQGPNEQWGVRVNGDSFGSAYTYSSPYAIIHTPNARLNIAKLEMGASVCPTAAPAGGSGFNPIWNGSSSSWTGTGVTQLRDVPYVAELNVGGKYVYGYNWALKRDQVAPATKAGWWRLTFYASDVTFDSGTLLSLPPAVEPNPPSFPIPAGGPAIPAISALAEGDTGPLYVPVIDPDNNLTYIDICIVEGNSRGGGSGGSGRN